MTAVRLDAFLKAFGATGPYESSANDVDALLDELELRYPRLRLKLRDETGEVRRFVRVFVNGEDIRNGAGRQTRLAGTDKVDILHSIQGG